MHERYQRFFRGSETYTLNWVRILRTTIRYLNRQGRWYRYRAPMSRLFFMGTKLFLEVSWIRFGGAPKNIFVPAMFNLMVAMVTPSYFSPMSILYKQAITWLLIILRELNKYQSKVETHSFLINYDLINIHDEQLMNINEEDEKW